MNEVVEIEEGEVVKETIKNETQYPKLTQFPLKTKKCRQVKLFEKISKVGEGAFG